MKRHYNSWYAGDHRLLKCPVPGCTHQAPILTKVHFRLEHNMERHEVEKKYGMPEIITIYVRDERE